MADLSGTSSSDGKAVRDAKMLPSKMSFERPYTTPKMLTLESFGKRHSSIFAPLAHNDPPRSRSDKCTVMHTALKDIKDIKDDKFLKPVFDRIRRLISAERKTEDFKGTPTPRTMENFFPEYTDKDCSRSGPMVQQSTSVNNPDLGIERRNKTAVDSVSDSAVDSVRDRGNFGRRDTRKNKLAVDSVSDKGYVEVKRTPPHTIQTQILPRRNSCVYSPGSTRVHMVSDMSKGYVSDMGYGEGKWKNKYSAFHQISDSDSVSDKGYVEGERTSPDTFPTLPPLPRDPYYSKDHKARRKARSDDKKAHSDCLKALSDESIPESEDCLTDAVEMQVNAQQDLQNQVEAQKASLGKTKSCLTTTFVKLDSDDACNDEHDSSMDKGRDNLLHEGRKMRISEPKIDTDQLCEDAYEVFKNEICEDIMKIDCIQELAIDCVDMDTLPEDPDMIILSFCDERKESFEFYFKSREDMASIVGVGMLHAKVTLEGGEITITEIMEEDWNQKWGSVARNSKGNVKLFKIKRAFPSGVREGLTHLNVEISTRKPFLWELTKYFSLKECIATFASKEMYAKCANGGEASSSSSSNNEVQQSYIIARLIWVVKNIIVRKSSDENGGSVSNQSQERVMECSKSTATTVKLQLLSGGCIKKLEGMESCIGQIVPNLEFTFTNEGEGKKSIQIVVGEISFQFTRSENGDQGNWYHTKFRVIFGLLNANIQRYGLFER